MIIELIEQRGRSRDLDAQWDGPPTVLDRIVSGEQTRSDQAIAGACQVGLPQERPRSPFEPEEFVNRIRAESGQPP